MISVFDAIFHCQRWPLCGTAVLGAHIYGPFPVESYPGHWLLQVPAPAGPSTHCGRNPAACPQHHFATSSMKRLLISLESDFSWGPGVSGSSPLPIHKLWEGTTVSNYPGSLYRTKHKAYNSTLHWTEILTDVLLYAKVSLYQVGHDTDMWYVLLLKLSLKIIGISLIPKIHSLSFWVPSRISSASQLNDSSFAVVPHTSDQTITPGQKGKFIWWTRFSISLRKFIIYFRFPSKTLERIMFWHL